MKIVDSNKWAPRHKLNLPMPVRIYYYEGVSLEIYIPELDELHVPIDLFYYRLAYLLYDFLGEGDYFYEDD